MAEVEAALHVGCSSDPVGRLVKEMMRFAALLGGLGLVAVVMTACGGNGENELSPTVTSAAAPAEDRARVEELLKTAALRAEDLPEGFTLDEEKFVTNEESASKESAFPGAPTLDDLNRFGRILGYEAGYHPEESLGLPPAGTVSFLVTTDIYRDSEGAGEHFDLVRRQPSDPGFVKAFEEQFAGSDDVDLRDASISSISLAKVGDDRMAFEIKFKARYPDLDSELDLIAQLVAVRRGRAIGAATALAVGSPSPLGESEDLAHELDERLKDALE